MALLGVKHCEKRACNSSILSAVRSSFSRGRVGQTDPLHPGRASTSARPEGAHLGRLPGGTGERTEDRDAQTAGAGSIAPNGARLARGSATTGVGPNTERQYRQALDEAGLLRGDPNQLPEVEVLKQAVLEHAPPKLPPQQRSSVAQWRPPTRSRCAPRSTTQRP